MANSISSAFVLSKHGKAVLNFIYEQKDFVLETLGIFFSYKTLN